MTRLIFVSVQRQRLRPVTSDQLKRKNIQEFFLKDLKNNALMRKLRKLLCQREKI